MKSEGFFFNVKQWLGDDSILFMDWDVRGYHIHLMALAWQQDPPGTLNNDDAFLMRILGSNDKNDWLNRVKPQLFRSWKVSPDQTKIIQEGLFREWQKQSETIKKRQYAANIRWSKVKEQDSAILGTFSQNVMLEEHSGFSVASILSGKGTFFEKASGGNHKDTNVWDIGVSAISTPEFSPASARAFLAKLSQQYGEQALINAIGLLSVKKMTPVDAKSYLVGVLKGGSKSTFTTRKIQPRSEGGVVL